MDDDRERSEPFTDDEFAFLRHARFGNLPARVEPDKLVELAETDLPHEEPPDPMVRLEWG
ncbi:MAG TPA: hypothetical protein VFX61_15960 [Micromonosporaceae bacterium]|nr:hypothetical protein [Micromonosporaceae bacterium]